MRLMTALAAIGCLAAIAAASESAAQTSPPATAGAGSATAGSGDSGRPAGPSAAPETPAILPSTAADAAGSPATTVALPPVEGTAAAPVSSTPPANGEGPLPPAVPRVGLQADTDVTIDRRSSFAASIGYAGPIGASASLSLLRGLGADVRERDGRVQAVCAAPIPHCANGFLLETAAGVHGGRLSLGFAGRAKVDEEDFHGIVGAGLKLSAVRTWNAHEGDEPDRTWLGPELDVVVKRIGLSVGLLWPVSGELSASPRFSWGVGLVL
jgi:hypothetical protein